MGVRRAWVFLHRLALLGGLALTWACGGSSTSSPPAPLPSITAFTASPTTIAAGQSSTLSWTVTNATSLSIDGGVGAVTGTSKSVSPAATTTYTLTATGAGGSATASATVTVVPAPVIASFTATPAAITLGQSSTLAWTVTGATSLAIDQGVGTVTGTSTAVSPAATTTYTLTATNSASGVSATSTRTAVVTVSGPATFNFGNAPDGTSSYYPNVFGIIHPAQTGAFPTLKAHNGARTQSIADGILGTKATLTADAVMVTPTGSAADFSDDDGLLNLVVVLTSIPPPAAMSVKVTAPVGSSGGTMYLNVLFDKDMNGMWNGASEWVVKNQPVNLPAAGSSITVTPPAFAFSNGNTLPDPAWMRIALTREQVPGATWDGSGLFSSGEIEDYLVFLPGLANPNPPPPPPPWPVPPVKKVPVLTVVPGGPYTFPNGVGVIPISFTVYNWAATTGFYTYNYFKLDGNVAVTFPVPPAKGNPIGAAVPGMGLFTGPATDTVNGTATSPGPAALPSDWEVDVTPVDPPALFFPGGVFMGETTAATGILPFSGVSHTFSVTSETLSHYRGVTMCPTPFTPLIITNTGTVPLSVNTSNGMAWVSLDKTGGTIPVGGTLTINPSFPCSGYVVGSQSGTLYFTIQGGSTLSSGPQSLPFSLTVY